MKDDLEFLRLWDMYSPLLTLIQQEITELYFNCDLSLGEIAEQKGVSRQSISDCLRKSRKQLERCDEKLGFIKTLDEQAAKQAAYEAVVTQWLDEQGEGDPKWTAALSVLRQRLQALKDAESDGEE